MSTTNAVATTKKETSAKTATNKKQSVSKPITSSKGCKKTAAASKPKKPALAPAKPVEIIDKAKYSKRLEESTGKIRKEINGIAKSFCKIGYELYEVREKKLYLGMEYKNVAEYAEAAFKFQKSSVANYIAICERFSVRKNGKPTAQLLPEFEAFNYGQLSIMLSLPSEKLPEITPDKTCSEIREIKIQEKIKKELNSSSSAYGSAPATSSVSSPASGSGLNLVEYVIAWHYNNEPVPLKTANLKMSPDKVDKIYKEICVLLNNDWTDFGRDGDSLTVGLVNKPDGDSN